MATNSAAQLLYQVSPIFLTGGITSQLPTGSVLPLMWLTNRQGDPNYAYTYNVMGLPPIALANLDDAFGAFTVLPGGNLVSQQIAKYPFANQNTAANATIREPLSLSVIMDAPMRGPNAWANKFAIMTAMKATLDIHNNAGGTYVIYTPAFMYTNMVMTGLTDASRATSATNTLPQNAWKFDFERPLVALEELTVVYSLNLQMLKLANGTPTQPVVTGVQTGAQVAQGQLWLPGFITSGISGLIAATGLGLGNQPPAANTTTPGGIQTVVGTNS